MDTAKINAGEVKQLILSKFGSLAHFCRLTGRTLQVANIKLRLKRPESIEYVAQMMQEAKAASDSSATKPAPGYHLTEAQRRQMRAALDRQQDSIVSFCEAQNREYEKAGIATRLSPVFVSRIVGGRTRKITPRVRELAKLLEVSLPNS